VDQIEFHGLLASHTEILVNGSEGATRIDVKAALTTEELCPSAILNKVMLIFLEEGNKQKWVHSCLAVRLCLLKFLS